LSFVSSSTGYSSARSSLRSSEIGEESFLSKCILNFFRQESLLSEARRLKLMKKSNISQFDRIAMELLETERCYVNDLSDIIQGYLNFFIGHREQFQMTVDDVSNTFGCIERIYLFNKRLFCQLDRTLLNVVQMARCFVDNIDGFKDYVTYCANYQKMVDTLANLVKNPNIVHCLSIRQAMLGHSLPLSAYLLKPVQRVLKYHLFMENVLKQSSESRVFSDADLATVKKALQCLTCLADKINEEKKRVEHWERVRELQSALHSWSLDKRDDLFEYGDLLLEGVFKIAGSKTNRQLFLFEEMLLIVKERNNALICKDYIMCSSIMLNESVGSDPLSFQVMSYDNPKIQYIFIATSLEQKRKWMKELKRMMLDHYDVKIPEKAKLLMLNTDNVAAKQPISAVSGECRKVPKYLEKKRKHRDASVPKTSVYRNRPVHGLKSATVGNKSVIDLNSPLLVLLLVFENILSVDILL
uniref:DH domain-containing protein n=1 Tax=Syphacia muris TaxID=451379 RepID=A0A0N5ANQ8_9BILA